MATATQVSLHFLRRTARERAEQLERATGVNHQVRRSGARLYRWQVVRVERAGR